MNLPCVTCTDVARDCGTCADYGAWLAVVDPDPPSCLQCADAEWLLLCGETFDTTAARLHLTPESLRRHLQRHRPDLVPPRRDRGAA